MKDPHSNNQVLTEHIALSRTRAGSLADLKTLNLWGYNFRDVKIFHKIPNIEIASLPVNEIERLEPFSDCRKLRELYLRQNKISQLSEVQYLAQLPYLSVLDLSDNPVTTLPNYRNSVIHALPQLKKLDNIEISENERKNMYHQPVQPSQSSYNSNSDARKERHFSNNNQMNNQITNQMNNPANNHMEFHQTHPHHYQMHDDSAALTAILALLPELSPQSISVVLEAISKLTD